MGKSGVGDAVDSYNLNATFFESRGVRVLGAVFNRLPREGFYSVDQCREVRVGVATHPPRAHPRVQEGEEGKACA